MMNFPHNPITRDSVSALSDKNINMENEVHQKELRKRGRPAGKNRVPLSQNERRARNAQYERERREDMVDAFADLAAAVGITGSITNAELLATVITQLQRASQVKHSSDIDSLRRCNKNLTAQIEMLEQRLSESDEIESSEQSTLGLTNTPRPVKRKRDDCETLVEVPVPKLSPRECNPSVDCAIEQDHGNENPPPDYLPKQECKPTDPWLPVADVSPQPFLPILQTSLESGAFIHQERYLPFEMLHVPSPGCKIEVETSEYIQPVQRHTGPFSSESSFKQDQHHTSSSEGTNHSVNNANFSTNPWLPVVATSLQDFPTTRESPVSNTSDQQDCDVDYSTYHFAGPQVPTPEYRLDTMVESSEYIHPVQQYTDEAYCHPSPWMYRSSPSSPDEPFSPSQYVIPETHHEFACPRYQHSGPSMDLQQPVCEVPEQPNIVGSVEFIPVHRNSSLPNVSGAEQDPRQEGFISPENLIAMYFPPMDPTAI